MNVPDERVLKVGSAHFDALSGEFCMDGRTVKLRPRTAALLACLVRNSGRLVTKDELMQAVWPEVVVTEDSIVQCVKEIRHAFGEAGREWIRTVPRQGYAFVADAGAQPAPEAARRERSWRIAAAVALLVVAAGAAFLWWPAAPQPPLSMVVLPIVNLTGDPARESAADDLTENLAAAMWGVQTLTVIDPRTAFTFKGKTVDLRKIGSDLGVRYVLEGSLREQGGKPVLKLRLADATNASLLWNEDFVASGGFNALHGDVIARVARSLGLHLAHEEAQRSQRERPGDPTAADLVNQARVLMRGTIETSDASRQARPLLEEALRRDDSQVEAWILLSRTYLSDLRFSATREDDLRRAADAAARALALAPDLWASHSTQALVLYNQRRARQALAEYDRALELDPNVIGVLAGRGAVLITLGRPEQVIEPLEKAMRLSPRDPQLALWQMLRGVAELHLGHDEAAVTWLNRSVDGNARNPFARLFLASALGATGRANEAREQMAEFQRLRPGFTLSKFRAGEPSDDPEFLRQREHVYAGLRAAGMPD